MVARKPPPAAKSVKIDGDAYRELLLACFVRFGSWGHVKEELSAAARAHARRLRG